MPPSMGDGGMTLVRFINDNFKTRVCVAGVADLLAVAIAFATDWFPAAVIALATSIALLWAIFTGLRPT